MEYPGVRFDIEADDNALLATTSMTKEISGFTNAIKKFYQPYRFWVCILF